MRVRKSPTDGRLAGTPGRSRLVAVLLVVAAIGAAGCVAPRAALGTSTSPCFQALPVAGDAVAHQGRLAGVARVTGPAVANLPKTLLPRPPRLRSRGPSTSGSTSTTAAKEPGTAVTGLRAGRPSSTTTLDPLPGSAAVGPGQGGVPTTTMTGRALCLVAFRGTFDANQIPLLRGPRRAGKYAVVVVGVRTRRAGAVFLTDQLPRAFAKA